MKSTNVLRNSLRNILASVALAACVAFGNTAQAQDDTDTAEGSSVVPGTFNFGGRTGVTFGYFNGPGYANDRRGVRSATKKGFQVGGFFTYHLTDWLSASAELNFMQTGEVDVNFSRDIPAVLPNPGFNPEYPDRAPTTVMAYGVSSGTSNITLNHIDIPLLVVVRPPFLEKVNPFLKFGPSFGFNLTAVQTKVGNVSMPTVESVSGGEAGQIMIVTGDPVPFTQTDVVSSQFSEIDFGLNFGAGTKMVLPGAPFDLVLEGRYRWGMNNVNRSAGTDFSVQIPQIANTNTLMVLIGLEF